jgi:hypothetical protein
VIAEAAPRLRASAIPWRHASMQKSTFIPKWRCGPALAQHLPRPAKQVLCCPPMAGDSDLRQ